MTFAAGDRVGCFGKYGDAWTDMIVSARQHSDRGSLFCYKVSDGCMGAFAPEELTPLDYNDTSFIPEDWS